MLGEKLTNEEIDEFARFMTTTADVSFRAFFWQLTRFIESFGIEIRDEKKMAELGQILRAMDGHRCEQVKSLMKLAQDGIMTTVHPMIVIQEGQSIVAAASLRSDESHDPEL